MKLDELRQLLPLAHKGGRQAIIGYVHSSVTADEMESVIDAGRIPANYDASDLQRAMAYAIAAAAVAAGIEDRGYNTVGNGWVPSFRGESVLTLCDGSRWLATGTGPAGTPAVVHRAGHIRLARLD